MLRGTADNYDAYYVKRALYWSFNVVGKARPFRRLCRDFGVPASAVRVLDVGFGSGAMLLQFSQHCFLAGLELSQSAIRREQRKTEGRWLQKPDLRLWEAKTLF